MPGSFMRLLRNRYVLAGLAFVLWLLFLDEYNWLGQAKVRREWRLLQKQKSFYDSSIQVMTREKAALESDTLLLERLAREKYRMVKPGESVFWLSLSYSRFCLSRRAVLIAARQRSTRGARFLARQTSPRLISDICPRTRPSCS